ncbi:SPOR domain-containing protein [Chlorobaculum thiosulfatiphilum]|nr:SPOR domain-containing protein [Chlorobaculum thiosulfatiphilum]
MLTMRVRLFILVCVMTSFGVPILQQAAVADEISYASEIAQYVREDKVYLLENIRPQIRKPSEKVLVDALLTEDGPKAAKLYRKQLADYPDPQIDTISRSRIAAYEQAITIIPGLPVMQAKASTGPRPSLATTSYQPSPPTQSAVKPDSSLKRISPPPAPAKPVKKSDATVMALPKPPAQVQSSTATGGFTLQFGSFDSVTNADQMAAQLKSRAPARVRQINGVYKVRLQRTFATEQEAEAFARTFPIESIVVPQLP